MYTNPSVRRAISLHPIKDPNLLHRMHQYALQLRLTESMKSIADIQNDLQKITKVIPREMTHFEPRKWLWYELGTNPTSRYDIKTWEYFNTTRQFQEFEHMPVIGLSSSLKIGVNLALEILLPIMNEQEGSKNPFVPPYHLYDGFTTLDHSSGVQYSLHMSVNRKGIKQSHDYVAEVFIPFNGAGMATFEKIEKRFSSNVHIIVCVSKATDLSDFIQMYTSVCLNEDLPTELHIVQFGANSRVDAQINSLKYDNPRAKVTTYEVSSGNFSHSVGYQLVAEHLHGNDLLLLFDYGLTFTSEFINHCRMNTIQNKQVYFPMLFSFYKPDLVAKNQQRPPQMLISADSGFFLRYNYQVVSIYQSDYMKIVQLTGSTKGNVNEDVRFLNKVLSSDVYVMRALEPYLRRNYRPRSCQGLSGNTRLACLNSRAEAIGSKKLLGSVLVSHDLIDSI